MNALGYQAMALGNHEFDLGPATLASSIPQADFPVLSANLDASTDPDLSGLIQAYTVLNVAGEKVGVFGLTTPDAAFISSPGTNVIFGDTFNAAQAVVDAFEGQGVNKIVALTHLGYGVDQKLAAAVDGVDVIVGGHSHTPLGNMEGAQGPYPTVVNAPSGDPGLIVSAYDWGRYLGRLDVTFSADGVVETYAGAPIFVDQGIPEDAGVAADVDQYAQPLEELRSHIVGQSAVDLNGDRELVRSQETNLGNLICDAMLWKSVGEDTQICLVNGGRPARDDADRHRLVSAPGAACQIETVMWSVRARSKTLYPFRWKLA